MNLRVALGTFGALAALGCSAHAAAGTYVEASRTDLHELLRSPVTERMWFDGGSFRLENQSGDAVEILKDGTLYLLEPLRKRYTAFDAASLRTLLSGRHDTHAARGTSRTESSGGRACTIWEISVDGVKVQELCVIPAASIPDGAQIMADMRQVGALIEQMGLDETLSGSVASSWNDLALVDGIPILSRSFIDGQAAVEIQITAVRADSVPFTAFVVPAGFKREKPERRGRI